MPSNSKVTRESKLQPGKQNPDFKLKLKNINNILEQYITNQIQLQKQIQMKVQK